MKRSFSFFLLIFCAVCAGSAFAQTSASFVPINFPGAFATGARGVNSHGEIVGWFQLRTDCLPEESGIPFCIGALGSQQLASHGFILLNGKFTRFDFPGATATAILGVNELGDFVGTYFKANQIHGFLRLHTGVLKTLDIAPPGVGTQGTATAPMGINKFGTVVGSQWSVFGEGPFGGFRWFNGHFTKVNFPGFTEDGVFGNSNTGLLIMQVFDHDFWTTGLVNGSDDDLLPSPSISDAHATGVNSGGDIVLSASGSGFFAPHVEANEGTTDTEIMPKYLAFKFPGSVETRPNAISDNRSIVGSYSDGKTWHGFMAVLH
ncbi:MAG TPA: hypothetical protein VKH81_19360 [Candidatus Angelobacter sp.]|nr:hypothetical protein [Candidatus Angelobacter sp.]